MRDFYEWIAYIGVGASAKLGWEMITKEKQKWTKIIGSTAVAIFVGFMASAICINNEIDGKVIVPVATLLSDKLMFALFSINYKKLIDPLKKCLSDD